MFLRQSVIDDSGLCCWRDLGGFLPVNTPSPALPLRKLWNNRRRWHLLIEGYLRTDVNPAKSPVPHLSTRPHLPQMQMESLLSISEAPPTAPGMPGRWDFLQFSPPHCQNGTDCAEGTRLVLRPEPGQCVADPGNLLGSSQGERKGF